MDCLSSEKLFEVHTQLLSHKISSETIFKECASELAWDRCPRRSELVNELMNQDLDVGHAIIIATQKCVCEQFKKSIADKPHCRTLRFTTNCTFKYFPSIQRKFFKLICNHFESRYSANDVEVVSNSIMFKTYEYLLEFVKDINAKEVDARATMTPEDPGSLYMVGGAAIASLMRVLKKVDLRSRRCRKKLALELDSRRMMFILSRCKMTASQKAELFKAETDKISFLKNLDLGHLYVPSKYFLPYLKKIYSVVRIHCNKESFDVLKHSMIRDAKNMVDAKMTELQRLFGEAVNESLTMRGVNWKPYPRLVEKLCTKITYKVVHTKIEVFMHSLKQTQCQLNNKRLKGGNNCRVQLYEATKSKKK